MKRHSWIIIIQNFCNGKNGRQKSWGRGCCKVSLIVTFQRKNLKIILPYQSQFSLNFPLHYICHRGVSFVYGDKYSMRTDNTASSTTFLE